MKLLVTGATGFTGSYTVPRLIEEGYAVRCLVRPSSDRSHISDPRIEWIIGNVEERESLARAMRGVDTLVNIVSLGFGHAPNIIEVAVEAGVKRAVFVSTTAIFTTLNAPSKGVRLHAEEMITKSGLAYTILRPTMIYGSARDRNMCRLIRYIRRWPMIPILGNGKYLQQPVYVGDVAQAIVLTLLTDTTIGKAYNISGATALSYNAVVDTISGLLKRRVLQLPVPASPMIRGLKTLERLRIKLPITAEQVLRLNEDKTFDWTAAHQDFGYQPCSFREGMILELREMGLYA